MGCLTTDTASPNTTSAKSHSSLFNSSSYVISAGYVLTTKTANFQRRPCPLVQKKNRSLKTHCVCFEASIVAERECSATGIRLLKVLTFQRVMAINYKSALPVKARCFRFSHVHFPAASDAIQWLHPDFPLRDPRAGTDRAGNVHSECT